MTDGCANTESKYESDFTKQGGSDEPLVLKHVKPAQSQSI